MNRILIIEDDTALALGLCRALSSDDCKATYCSTVKQARELLSTAQWNLLILDVNLPDGNGMDFLKELRRSSDMKVILLTANDMETDVVSGLELGADDYITKPFSLAILRARVKIQLKSTKRTGQDMYLVDDFSFDFTNMQFTVRGDSVELSKTEQKLLRMLVENRGITLERGVLVDRIWTDGADYVDENALSVTVKRLRDKLEEKPSRPKYIKTVYGIGYVWEDA